MYYLKQVKRASLSLALAAPLAMAGIAPAAAIPVLFSSFQSNPSLVRSPTTISFPSQSNTGGPNLSTGSLTRSGGFSAGATFSNTGRSGSRNNQLTFGGGNAVFGGSFVTRSSGASPFRSSGSGGATGGTTAGQGGLTTLFAGTTTTSRRGIGGRFQRQSLNRQNQQTTTQTNFQTSSLSVQTQIVQPASVTSVGLRTAQTIGQNVPEPGLALMLVLGSGGLLALRSRRSKLATTQS